MRNIERRLLRLETQRPDHPVDPEASAVACAVLGALLNDLAAEKAAGDVSGEVVRKLGELLALAR